MRQINFLGIPFNVMDEDDIDEAAQAAQRGDEHYYMVLRVEDTDPTAGSSSLRARRQRTLCEKCRAVCFIDPKSYEEVARIKMTIICSHCFYAKVKAAKAAEKGSAGE